METPRIQEDRVRERAYSLWEAEGCPDGCADRHWQQAEAELFEAGDGGGMAGGGDARATDIPSSATTSDAPGVAGRSRRRA